MTNPPVTQLVRVGSYKSKDVRSTRTGRTTKDWVSQFIRINREDPAMHKYLRIASHLTVRGNKKRKAYIACVGVRRDGTVVQSWNGCSTDVCPPAHAEARLARKLDVGSIVYVARTRRDDGRLAMAKPCPNCERVLRNRGVSKVIYSIAENEWGTLEF